MAINLLNDPWIPVRLQDGSRQWVTPAELSRSDVVAFDAPRPDFNVALAQFVIALLQSTDLACTEDDWWKYFEQPPGAETLTKHFALLQEMFNLDGVGVRFMQDADLPETGRAQTPIAALLIDSPGENTLRNNSDHFVKRGRVNGMCPGCAGTALFTLQINAPSGGAGHRTGLRGGGPLSTLLELASAKSLWHDLWLNVQHRNSYLRKSNCNPELADKPGARFPWEGSLDQLQPGESIAPMVVHPDHVLWAMPRRIRLDFGTATHGQCDICGREEQTLLHQYNTQNYGLNYKAGWLHPLSPYYEHQDEWLPLHPQAGGVGYRHWLGWVLGLDTQKHRIRRAAILEARLSAEFRLGSELRLWCSGYEMDNMKPICWHESRMPLYRLQECSKQDMQRIAATVEGWTQAAQLAVVQLRGAVREAWFGSEAKGDFSAVDTAFWDRTESAFYHSLRTLMAPCPADANEEARHAALMELNQGWLKILQSAALSLFETDFVGTGQIDKQHPARVANAYKKLKGGLYGKTHKELLNLPR